jgi:chromate transport protein ChrA
MKLLLELFLSFFKIGAFTFGGGMAMLPVIRRVAVEEKQWLSDDEMIDCLALSQSLPGMLAINAAIYIGNRQKGYIGAVMAAAGAILPSSRTTPFSFKISRISSALAKFFAFLASWRSSTSFWISLSKESSS